MQSPRSALTELVPHQSANTGISASASSIIIAGVQVAATGVASVLMDKAGRRLLILVSSFVMCISLSKCGGSAVAVCCGSGRVLLQWPCCGSGRVLW